MNRGNGSGARRLPAQFGSVLLAAAAALAGCATPPPYRPPVNDLPPSWQAEAPWRLARPDDAAPKGPWWQRYGDPRLDALVQQALAANPTLALASARLVQARATLAAVSAGLAPQIGLSERATRLKSSANRPLSNYASPNFSTVQNDFTLAMTVGYELDLAGRLQSSQAAARASAQQTAADGENLRLLLLADLATTYFNLRFVDAELEVLNRSIALQQRALGLVRSRYEGGAASGLDVAQQQTLIDSTRVQLDLLGRQRSQFEHAIATLTGTPAPRFTLPADAREVQPPPVPLGVPSDLLQRRPDIAAAERAMAAANAQIGIANAAFYPSLTLGGNLGVDSRSLASLLDAPSLLWSFGISAAQVLFDGGRQRANLDVAEAGHAAATANYRRVVLAAMQEVEDGISGLAALERAAAQAAVAQAGARRVLAMSTARYEGGASTFLDVITAQQAVLTAERQATQLRGQRLVTSVFLFKALGGDWRAAGAADAPMATGAP